MTETQWLNAAEPEPMVEFLRGRVSARKLRLFARACCRTRRVLADLGEWLQGIVEKAERYADGRVPEEELFALYGPQAGKEVANPDAFAAALAAAALGSYVASGHDRCDGFRGTAAELDYYNARVGDERRRQCRRCRCIFGNPFRPVRRDPRWLSANVTAIALGIYESRAFDRMPVLADALEEAGCEESQIRSHCRERTDHTLGCWVVDLILDRD